MILTHANRTDLWEAVAAAWRESAEAAVRTRGFFAAALSGGRTPEDLYRHLARETGLPWPRTQLFLVDERLVPPGSSESNARLVRGSLLENLTKPPAGVHFVEAGLTDEASAAAGYERQLRVVFSQLGAATPRLDLVLLGLGADGHTASLFPGSAALEEQSRLVAAVPASPPRVARVTLTLPLINASRRVIFLVTGSDKRRVLARVLAGDRDLPAARVDPSPVAVEFFVDREAFPDALLAPP